MMLPLLMSLASGAPPSEFSDQICVEREGPPKGARQIAASELPWTHEMRAAIDGKAPVTAPLEPLMEWLPTALVPPTGEDVPLAAGLTVAKNIDGTGWLVGVDVLAKQRTGLVPANVTVIVDVSDSMGTVFTRRLPVMQDERGLRSYRAVQRMELTKSSLHALVESFPTGSRLAIIAADGLHARPILTPTEDLERMHTEIERLDVGLVRAVDPGTVATLDAIGATTFVPCADNRVFLFTDTVNDTAQKDMTAGVQSWADKNVQVWTFAVGSYDGFGVEEVLLEQGSQAAGWALNAPSDVRRVWEKLFDAGGVSVSEMSLKVDFPEGTTWRALISGAEGEGVSDQRTVANLESNAHWTEIYEVIPTPPEVDPDAEPAPEGDSEEEPLDLTALDPSALLVTVRSGEWSTTLQLTDPETTEEEEDDWAIRALGADTPFLTARALGVRWARGELTPASIALLPALPGRGIATELRAWMAHDIAGSDAAEEIAIVQPLPWVPSKVWLEPGEDYGRVVMDLSMRDEETEDAVRSLALVSAEGLPIAAAPFAWNWRRDGASTTQQDGHEVRVVWRTQEATPPYVGVQVNGESLGDPMRLRAIGRDEAKTVEARYAFESPASGRDALAAIQLALKSRPEDGELAHLMTRYHRKRGENDGVIEWSSKCIDDPRPEIFVQCRLFRGRALEGMGQTKDAVNLYEDGLRRFKDSGPLNTAMGRNLLANGQPVRAEIYLLRAMTHDPEVPEAGPLLAECMEAMSMHSFAAMALARTLLRNPEDEESREVLWDVLDADWKRDPASRGPIGRVSVRNGDRKTQVGFLLRDWYVAGGQAELKSRWGSDLWYSEIVRPISRLGKRRLLKVSALRIILPPDEMPEEHSYDIEDVEWILLEEWQRGDDNDPSKSALRHRGDPQE